MKEATGELNMTVVTVVAIAALIAFFYLVIWPSVKTGMALTSACNSAGGTGFTSGDANGEHVTCTAASGTVTCTYYNEDGSEAGSRVCSN